MSKYVFLDVDGTLNESFAPVPESALTAIRQARANGHKVFLNTGRSKGEVPEALRHIALDGMVTSAGAYVEIDGKAIYDQDMGQEICQELYRFLDRHKVLYVLETQTEIIGTKEALDFQRHTFADVQEKHGVPREQENELEKIMRESEDVYHEPGVKKILYYNAPIPQDTIQQAFEGSLRVIASTISQEHGVSGEINDVRINKATGMQRVVEYFGDTMDQTIAVGDGSNDFEMIRAAGIGIAMGNADPALKAQADLVTTHVREDGLKHAFEQCGLI